MVATMKNLFRTLVLAAAVLALSGTAHADTTHVTVTSAGGGTFELQGIGLAGVAAMDIAVQYDPNTLGNPRVAEGALMSGSIMAVNPHVPGTLRIAFIRLAPVTGSGSIASLTFDSSGSASGPIRGMLVKLTDINGTPLPVQTQVVNPPGAAAPEPQQQAAAAVQASDRFTLSPQPAQPPAQPPVVGPGVVVPRQESVPAPQDGQPAVPPVAEPPSREPQVAKADDAGRRDSRRPPASEPSGKAVFTQKSVLDLFREHRGPRTPEALTALFRQDQLIGCRQEPLPVLSDGRATARIAFIAPADLKGSPDIALIGATLVTLERDRENTNTWIAVVRPHRNALEAKLTVSLTDTAMVIPLAVAPKAVLDPKKKGPLNEKDFAGYLKAAPGKRPPGRDVNGDGRQDYLDDYIFTANYLADQRFQGTAERRH